jgi:hypothetical protein
MDMCIQFELLCLNFFFIILSSLIPIVIEMVYGLVPFLNEIVITNRDVLT